MKKAFWIALVFFPLLLGAKISVNSPKQNTLPQLYFTPNLGQFGVKNPSIAQAVIPGGAVFITQNGIRIRMDHPDDIGNKHQAHHYRGKDTQFSVRYHISDIIFAGGQSPSKIQFLDPAPFYENYFLGPDPENWKSAVQPISKVILENIYPRIDVAIYFNNQNLEFDWILHPGANPNLIALELDKTNQWKILQQQIHIQNSVGAFMIQKPIASQKNPLQKKSKPVNVAYSVDSQNLIRLNVAKYDPQQTLIIDPVLVFSTYSGSQGDNFGFTATYDTAGCLYAGGIVEADTRKYPVTTGAFQTTYGGSGSGAPPVQLPCDISISKYSSDGTKLLYATYMGGSDDEYPHSLCVDPNNNLLVFGTTLSADFPVHPDSAFSDIHQTDYDIFVNKLSVDGTTLLGGTFIGGNDADGFQTENPFTFLLYNYADNYRGDITTDPKGNVFIATCTRSTNFPCTKGALQTKPTGETDAAVICLNSQLSRIKWATLIGGLDDDAAYSVKVDDSSHVFIGGGTVSSDFPMTGKGFMQTGLGNIDGYIARFSQTTGAYQVGTYWGSVDYEQIYFIDLDINNKVYFTGQTEGKFKRTAGCYGKDNTTQFVGRLSNDLSKEEFVTTFGNRTNSIPELCPSAFMVDNCYNIYFSGWGSVIGIGNNGTTSGLPITADAHQKTTDNHDFYLIVLGKDAKSLKYASYFGGNNSRDHVDGGTSRFDNRGIIYQSVCASCPNSPPGLNDFPTSPANVVFKNNVSIRCSNASFKLDFRLGYSIDAIFTVTPETVCLKSANAFQPLRKYDGSYLWDFGDGDTSHQFSPNHVYKDTGTYNVTLTVVDTNSCNARATYSKKIRVSIAPNGVCNINITPCKPGVDFVFDINNYDSIIWDFGDGSKIERTGGVDLKKYFDGNGVLKRNYQYFAGQYEAKFVIKNRSSGCTDTLKIPVQVNTDSTHEVKIANVFTPNGDGKNDCFRVFGIAPDCEEAEIRIFNRWGERVYYSKDLSNCWNGKVNNTGPELPSGTYFYQLDIIKSPFMKTPKHVAGSANLIR